MSSRQMTDRPTPISDAVVRSRNIQDALQCIALGLDEVLQRLEFVTQPQVIHPGPAWEEWSIPSEREATEAVRGVFTTEHIEAQLLPESPPAPDQIAAVREQLKTATGEDAQALQAQLNLLRDAAGEVVYDGVGSQQDMARNEGRRYQVDGDIVDLVPPTPERMRARYKWAKEHDLYTFLPVFADDPEGAAATFSKGGAVWLHQDGRQAIMQMPYEWRQWLVKDAAIDSEQQAQEMGADILKHRNSTDRLIAEEMADRG